MRVALVHDWLTGMRGGEWVLYDIARFFPSAPIYTLVHRSGSVAPLLEQHPIRTSWLQAPSFGGRSWRYLLPLIPFLVLAAARRMVDFAQRFAHDRIVGTASRGQRTGGSGAM